MRTVIVGAGAAGLEMACMMGKDKPRASDEVILVDKGPTHIWKPLFHQVAAGTLNSYQDELSYLYLGRRNGFRFELGPLKGIHPDRDRIRLEAIHDPSGEIAIPERVIQYDRLVLALGSEANDFGVPGVTENAYFLDSREQAEVLHRAFLYELARASVMQQDQRFDIVIVGAGATGVELSAELSYALDVVRDYGAGVDRERTGITLVEQAPRVLPPLPEDLAGAVQTSLTDQLGVNVECNAGVAEVKRDGVVLNDGRELGARMVIWTAGVRGPSVLADSPGVETDKRGHVVVDRHLRSTGDPRIHAIGDCAAIPMGDDGGLVPPRAQAAHQESAYLAKRILEGDTGADGEPFVYKDYGSLVSLANYTAYGKLFSGGKRSLSIDGWMAKAAYKSLYRGHQKTLLGVPSMVVGMLVDRLRKTMEPQLKMH